MLRLLSDESGSTTLMGAFGMVAIMAFLALAVDAGQLRFQRRNFQRGADAAALASTLEVNYCGGTPACATMQAAARSALAENGLTADNVVTNCGTAPATGLTLMINNGPCSLGTSDPNAGNAAAVEVILSQPQPSLFAGVLGLNAVRLGARAEGSVTSGTNCIYALDPTGSGALTVSTLASLTSPCGVVVESSSSSAVNCALLGYVSVPKLSVVGNVSSFLCTVTSTPKTGQALPTPADPLAYLPLPTVPSCGTSTSSPYHGSGSTVTVGFGQTATFYADGAYCGGITVASGGTATFNSGVYALTSTNGGSTRLPGGLTINLGTNVSGTGVTFYNYGPSGAITMLAPILSLTGVRLTAPTSGTYSGILFFQPSNNTTAATLIGSSVYNTTLEGAYYFPKAKVTFCLNGPTNYNILVAYDIVFAALTFGSTSVTSSFGNNYGTLATGVAAGGNGSGDQSMRIADHMQKLQKLWGEDGSSVLELALLMPVLLLLLVGAADFGQAYYVGIEVAAAAEAGTSYGVTNTTDTAGMRNAALLDAGDVPAMTAVATWGCECSDGTGGSVSCATTPSCTVNVVGYIDVATTANYQPMLIYPAFPSAFTVKGHSRMRVGSVAVRHVGDLRIFQEELGSELIEFTLSTIVLLMMIFGIMDCSRALYSYHYVAGVAREATRYASTRGATYVGVSCSSNAYNCVATTTDVTNYVKSLTPLGFGATNLTVTTTWPGTTVSGGVCSVSAINNSPGCVVSVKVVYSFGFVMPFLPKNALALASTSKVVIVQ